MEDKFPFSQKVSQMFSPKGESRMNTTKWQFLIAVALIIDGMEALLEYCSDWFFGIGHIIVMVAEIVIAPCLLFILIWQNVRITIPRFLSICSVFFGEEAGGDDFAPLWSGDIAFLWWADSRDRLFNKMGIVGSVAAQLSEAGRKGETGEGHQNTAQEVAKNQPPRGGNTPSTEKTGVIKKHDQNINTEQNLAKENTSDVDEKGNSIDRKNEDDTNSQETTSNKKEGTGDGNIDDENGQDQDIDSYRGKSEQGQNIDSEIPRSEETSANPEDNTSVYTPPTIEEEWLRYGRQNESSRQNKSPREIEIEKYRQKYDELREQGVPHSQAIKIASEQMKNTSNNKIDNVVDLRRPTNDKYREQI